MRVFIITMDDPVETRSFIQYIIDNTSHEIVGLAEAKGDRMTIGKDRSKAQYLLSLLLIMGIPYFVKNVVITMMDKVQKRLSKVGLTKNPSILHYAKQKGITTFDIKTPNSAKFQKELSALKPDVIVNQSQAIIKKNLLEIPSLGVINRHNALLPKNRGRLTPFWVLFKGEKETGVSIHFVTEAIDAGQVIVQKKYKVKPNESFASLVKRNYEIAPKAMVEALDILGKGSGSFLPNDDDKATYNTVPTLQEAFAYRKKKGLF